MTHRLAKLATEMGNGLNTLVRQLISSLSALGPAMPAAPVCLEAALLVVQAMFVLRTHMTLPSLTLEMYLRRIVGDSYAKRQVYSWDLSVSCFRSKQLMISHAACMPRYEILFCSSAWEYGPAPCS